MHDSLKRVVPATLRVLAIGVAALLCAPAHAQTLTWDANGSGAGVTDGGGAWLSGTTWWNGSSAGAWTANADAVFGAGGTGGTVTLSNTTSANSITFNAFAGTYTIGTSGTTLTIGSGGITMNLGSGTVTFSSPLSLGAAQTWTNNTGLLGNSNLLTISSTVTNNGNLLTVSGNGNTTISGLIQGTGGLTKSGSGLLILNTAANTYTGVTTVSGGILRLAAANSLPGGIGTTGGQSALTLNGGVLELGNGNFTRNLGTGTDQFQITGGTSGFSAQGAARTVTINNSRTTEVQWGSATFAPTNFILNAVTADNAITFANNVDLNGANRTVTVVANTATISGTIRTSAGTAGLTKEGLGTLTLGTNSYNGPTTINGGVLSVPLLANGGANSSIGASTNSASNLVISSGTLRYTGGAVNTDRGLTISGTGTLEANGSGVVSFTSTSGLAYGTANQARTLGLAGTNSGTNTLAALIADNGTGQVSIVKTGAGTWVLSNANTYTGTTTLAGGLLSGSAAANFGAASAPMVFNGGGLQVTGTSLTSLGRTVTFTTGSTATFDIASAANTFTLDQAITTRVGGLTKSGAGTLALTATNTLTGGVIISGGTLQIGAGSTAGSLSGGAAIANSAALVVNRSGTLTQSTGLGQIITGTGSLTNVGAGTLVLDRGNWYSGLTRASSGTIQLANVFAARNSALDTTGAGRFAFSGANTFVLGGLSGTSGNLSTSGIFDSSYSTVSNLTLNLASGVTGTYAGAIADGAAGMNLTVAGAGTQVFTGSNTYTGTTTVGVFEGLAGSLTLSGSGSIASSSAYVFSGGLLTLTNTNSVEGAFNRLSDTAPISSYGGTLNFNNTTAGSAYAETTGTATLFRGQLNVALGQNVGSGTQTLTLSGLLRDPTTSGSTAVVTFSANGTGPQTTGTGNRIVVTGGGSTAAGAIIGPWATTGTAGAGVPNDYAIFVNGTVTGANYVVTQESTWASGTNAVFNTGTGLTASRTVNTLRYSGAAAATGTLTGFQLATYGVLNGGAGLLTLTGGTLTTPSGGGNLFLTANTNGLTISSTIADNSGAVTLVKSGPGTLTLSSANSYSGGTVINSGVISYTNDNQLGAAAGGITFNGIGTLTNSGGVTGARSITINSGAVGTIQITSAGGRSTTTGNLTGDGTLIFNGTNDTLLTLSGSGSFAGPVWIQNTITGANRDGLIANNPNLLADSAAVIRLGGGSTGFGGMFRYTGSGPLTFNNRWLELNASTAGQLYVVSSANGTAANSLTFNRPVVVNATAAGTLLLAGGNTGTNAIAAGGITNGANGAVIAVTLGADGVGGGSGASWYIGGTNSYSGATTIVGIGTLTFRGQAALPSASPITLGAGSTLRLLDDGTGVVNYGNAVTQSGNDNRTLFVGNNSTANGGDNPASTTTNSVISLGVLSANDDAASGSVPNRTITINGANGYSVRFAGWSLSSGIAGSGNIAGGMQPTSASVEITGTIQQRNGRASGGANTLWLGGTNASSVISGVIVDAADFTNASNVNAVALAVTKAEAGTWTLSGVNTYTGTTTISAGVLRLGGAGQLGSGSYAAPIVITSGTFDVASSANNLFSGAISGAGVLNKSGTGTLTLSGTNTATGATWISGGVLLLNSGSAIAGGIGATGGQSAITMNGGVLGLGAGNFARGLGTGTNQVDLRNGGGFAAYGADRTVSLGGSGAAVTWNSGSFVNSGSTFILGAAGATNTVDFQNPISLGNSAGTNRTIQVDNGSAAVDAILSSAVTGTANLVKSGAGTLALTANNTFTGTTSITGGTLQVGNGGTTGSLAGNVNVSTGAALAFNRSDALVYGGTISGAGGLTKAGNNILTLTSAQTYTGATAITGGVLQIGNGGASGSLSDSSPVSVSGGAGLTFNRSDALTYGGTISGAGGLTKAGAGTLTLTSVQTYTGTTTITGGVLQLGVADALANTSSVLVNGGGFNLGGFNDTVGAVTLTSGSIFGSGKLTAPTYALAGGTVAANLGAGTLTVTGNSLLTATSEATAVNINAGTLTVGNGGTSGALSGTPNVAVSSGAGLAFNRSDALTYGGTISGAGGLTKAGAGTLTLTASNAYTGATTIAGGTIQVGAAGALGTGNLAVNAGGLDLMGKDVLIGMLSGSAGSSITSSVGGSASLTVNMSQSAVFGGVISDGASVVSLKKAGTETLTLTAAQTYTGDTIISGGMLALGSGASLASTFIKAGETLGVGTLDVTALSGGLVVASTQTLGGYGTVLGDVVIANGATVSPGGSIGTFATTGNVTFGGAGHYLFEITDATGSAGSAWDLYNVGTLGITSGSTNPFIVDLQTLANPGDDTPGLMSNWDNTQNQQWKFLVAPGTTFGAGNFSSSWFQVSTTNFLNTPNGSFYVARGGSDPGGLGGTTTANELYIVYAAVPEPGTLVLAGIGIAGLAWRLRRRRV